MQPSGPGTQGWNRYAYAGNNPATLTDPSGHSAGFVQWLGTVTLEAGALGIAAMDVQFVAAGEASGVLAVGGISIGLLGLVALTIAVALAVIAVVQWCQWHGCAMPSFDVRGLIKGLTTAGRTAFLMTIGMLIGGVLAQAAVCALSADAADGRTASELALGCPPVPRPDCEVEEAIEDLIDVGETIVEEVVSRSPAISRGSRPVESFTDSNFRFSKQATGSECKDQEKKEKCPPLTERPRKVPKPGGKGKEGATDIPSWVKNLADKVPYAGEKGADFAKRLLDAQFGPNNYPRGPGSDFNKVQKWADRHFENPPGWKYGNC